MSDERRNWSEHELIVAFNLYCKLPFGQLHRNNRKVIELSKILGRTPSSVSLKLCNFARLDPIHQKRGIKGMQHGSKLEEKIWNEFNQNWEQLAYQSEIILAELKGMKRNELINELAKPESVKKLPEGKEREIIAKARINQNFFREMILASYRSRCAICSLPETNLLVASHIVPWSINASLRINPQNGICMCSLHDKAFDRGLIAINNNFKLLISKRIKNLSEEIAVQRGFLPYENAEINLPDKFLPDKHFIEYHREKIFLNS